MGGKIILSVFFGILILGINGFEDAFAEPFSFLDFEDSFVVSTGMGQEDSPTGVTFSPDGTKMFVVGDIGDAVYEYTLSTAFDISTASFADSWSVEGENAPKDIAFRPDGFRMFVVGNVGKAVSEYSLITGFDLSSGVFQRNIFSVAGQDSSPEGVTFSSDGTKMFVVGAGLNIGQTDAVHEYTLTIGFDTSTASFTDSFLVTNEDTNPRGVAFSSDGTKMFVVGNDNDSVHEYTLSTAFDVSTASFSGSSFSVAGQEITPQGVTISSDGTKMFVVGDFGNAVYEYTIPSFVDSFSVAGQENDPTGVAISTDGLKMFVVGKTGDDVNEYTLSTAFNFSNVVFEDSFPVGGQTNLPEDVVFSPDGTKMFVVGNLDKINEYNLSPGFDVSTGMFVDFFSVFGSSGEASLKGVAFSPDGTKMFTIGTVKDAVYEYNLSPGFDVSSADFSGNSFSIAGEEIQSQGVAISTDGTKMFVVGFDKDTAYEYTLGTAFDVSTASFSGNALSVAAQDTAPLGVTFSFDGTKMFVVGFNTKTVYEYQISPLCSPPPSGDWTVTADCTMTGDGTVDAGNVVIQNGVVLTIPNGVTLSIPFGTHNLTVQSGGGVLIESGGKIVQVNG